MAKEVKVLVLVETPLKKTGNKLLTIKTNTMTTKALIKIAESIANQHFSGHLTILKFTTEWKVGFGTITERDEINERIGYDNLDDALTNLIQTQLDKY